MSRIFDTQIHIEEVFATMQSMKEQDDDLARSNHLIGLPSCMSSIPRNYPDGMADNYGSMGQEAFSVLK